uniref:Frizzled-4 n=1 Tax=Panagrolaimus sp. PS1159 TaxID=55785 RepID=A0AC35FF44_9BILA
MQAKRPIDIPLCKDIPYNQTIFPNPIFPHDQQSLQSQIEHFKPLIKTKCNPHIKFFICSVFAPMCPDQLPQAVTSCRSVCEEVKRDCIKILQEFDIQWPAPLNCSKFPEGPDLCMRPQEDTRLPPIETDPHSHLPDSRHLEIYKMKTYPSCPVDLIDLDPTDKNGTCAFRCNKDTMFTKESKIYAQYWIFLLSTINISIISFTVLSFLIDLRRFQFPERSILYIALCYLFYSLPYLARSFLSHEQTSCERIRLTERHFFVHGGLDNTICVVSFLFSYYFTIAGSIWWLMLTFTW